MSLTSPAPKITLLGLPAELRNAIYECTFATELKSKPTPHPLTQVNKQIRQESLAMYYNSVTYLQLPVQSLKSIARVKKWLVEFDLSAYGELPTIEFVHHWLQFDRSSKFDCTREVRCPADSVRPYLSPATSPPGSLEYDAVTASDYHICLGVVKPWPDAIWASAPHHFIRVIEAGGTWISRQVHFDGPRTWEWEFLGREDKYGSLMLEIMTIARRNKGCDWDRRDLAKIVGWFESEMEMLRDREAGGKNRDDSSRAAGGRSGLWQRIKSRFLWFWLN